MNAIATQPTSEAEGAFALAQRKAKAYASSTLVPEAYRGQENVGNILIAMEIANRIGANELMTMQSLYIVHGRPSWSSSFLIATVNACGRFTPMRFETSGDDPKADSYRVRAYAEPVVIVGTGVGAVRLAEQLRASPETGYRPIAFLDTESSRDGTSIDELPVIAPFSKGEKLAERVRTAIVSIERGTQKWHEGGILDLPFVNTVLLPSAFDLEQMWVSACEIGGSTGFRIRNNLLLPSNFLIKRALEEPLRQIALNAGLESSVVVNEVRATKDGFGLNAATGEVVDLVAAGVIDPAKVTRSALQNAASIAKNILTTEAIVAEVPEKDNGGGGMPDMGGMGGMM